MTAYRVLVLGQAAIVAADRHHKEYRCDTFKAVNPKKKIDG